MSCVIITDHARARYKERTSLSKSKIERDAELAWEKGVRFDEVSGSLRRYIDSQHFGSKMAALIRIWNGRVYIFKVNDDKKTLITVYDLPEKHRARGTEYRVRKSREH